MKNNINLTPPENEELVAVIEELNAQLLDESAASAMRAFNIGCVLSGFVIGVVVITTWVLSHFVSALIALLMTTLIAVSISSLLATRTRQNSLPRIYQETIAPKLREVIQQHEFSLEQWKILVAESLPEEAPLNMMLIKFPLEGNPHD